jgi:hypothetical protein
MDQTYEVAKLLSTSCVFLIVQIKSLSECCHRSILSRSISDHSTCADFDESDDSRTCDRTPNEAITRSLTIRFASPPPLSKATAPTMAKTACVRTISRPDA